MVIGTNLLDGFFDVVSGVQAVLAAPQTMWVAIGVFILEELLPMRVEGVVRLEGEGVLQHLLREGLVLVPNLGQFISGLFGIDLEDEVELFLFGVLFRELHSKHHMGVLALSLLTLNVVDDHFPVRVVDND